MFATALTKTQPKIVAHSANSRALQRTPLAGQGHDCVGVRSAQSHQRPLSNQATLRLLAQQASSQAETQSLSPEPPLSGILQRKLAIGEVDDPLEHEADRVADQVMRMPDPALSVGTASSLPSVSLLGDVQAKLAIGQPDDPYEREADPLAIRATSDTATAPISISRLTPGTLSPFAITAQPAQVLSANALQRQMAIGTEPEEEELPAAAPTTAGSTTTPPKSEDDATPLPVQTFCDQCKGELHRKAVGADEDEVSIAIARNVENRIRDTAGRGQPLSDETRGLMEPRPGYDFSAVNVHSDATGPNSRRPSTRWHLHMERTSILPKGSINPTLKQGSG